MPMKNKNQNEFNELPTKVSQKNFNKHVLPYLSKGSRGPKPKISLYKFFNYILFVLHTGIQWENLPISKKETSWQAVYAKHNRWCKDGSYDNLLLNSARTLFKNGKLDLSILHGDGSNTVAKKGVIISGIQGTNIKKEKKS